MKIVWSSITAGVVIGLLITGIAAAQFVKPEDAIEYRKAVMVLIGQHFKRMGGVVQGKMPYDRDTFAANAALVDTLASLPWEAMTAPGSEKGDTTLSPAVFAKGDELQQTADDFESAAARLAQTARGGDMDAIKSDFNAVAQSCKRCHDAFRK